MSGHNKWSKIKRKKEAGDAHKSKVFGKLARLIAVLSKKAGGNVNAPSLRAAVEKARKENMPSDNIDRAIKKGAGADQAAMETLLYEAYGPAGVAMMIEVLTDNRNKAAAEIKHLLSKNGASLAAQGAASWAFTKTEDGWRANQTMDLSDEDLERLDALVTELEDNEEVQGVFTNAD
ncbi:MAG: YebC/PmpR family DNA-binding transcriptional regulator [Candidatus Lloydbacteria bacterium]|nr:YebC/PmpR family DNA-binding transcriptional regulator [Candidatus Lloydbacteria bacterium]